MMSDEGEAPFGCIWSDVRGGFVDAMSDVALQELVDRAAGAFRLRFITDVPGQQAAYLDKERQARDFEAGAAIEDCGRIAAEADVRGITPAAMAAFIIATADSWRAIDTRIEAARIGAKQAVADADGFDAKLAAANVDWQGLLS